MCGRFTLHTEKELLAERFRVDLDGLEGLTARYNVAPTQSILTLRQLEGTRGAELMHWGLVPHWTQDRAKLPRMINARMETAASKPAYRDSFRRRRCLVLADGFYEWQAASGTQRRKLPHWISLRSGEPFAMAGLWAEWRRPDDLAGETLHSCTILTTVANACVAAVHPRMPVILPAELESDWLDPALDDDAEALLRLLRPTPAEHLEAHPVSLRVNSPRNDGPELIARADPAALGF